MHGVALVQRHGSTVAERAGGIADLGYGCPRIRSTRFQICSLSKQFAAAAVLLLVDRGESRWMIRQSDGSASARRTGAQSLSATC
jgi:CubicO group peptidase (beta-lactamase class C family)